MEMEGKVKHKKLDHFQRIPGKSQFVKLTIHDTGSTLGLRSNLLYLILIKIFIYIFETDDAKDMRPN